VNTKFYCLTAWLVGATRPFQVMGAWRNSTFTQRAAIPHGLDQRSKMEEVEPNMARRRGSDAEITDLLLAMSSILIFGSW